jgi:predicted amidohydrolase YtcJ
MFYKGIIFSLFSVCLLNSCGHMKKKVDLIVTNGVIYTVDTLNTCVEAMAISKGKIMALGNNQQIAEAFQAAEVLDLKGKTVFPGFIDAHCHFMGYALGLQYIGLAGLTSFDEVLQRLKQAARPGKGKWLVGRGWDQNLWINKNFPDNSQLNELFPDIPVMLIRIDGHVVLANQEALKRAGIGEDHHFSDGQVEMKNGHLTGILSETAADLIRESVPQPQGEELNTLIKQAEQQCFSVGLTAVSDAGLEYNHILILDSLQKRGRIRIHVYAMLTPTEENINEFVNHGPYITDKLVIRSIKIYADGSLGSRTAKLKHPYTDAKATSGIIVTSPDSIKALCRIAFEHGYQVNTHCIGDSANNLMLNIYGSFLQGKNDLRWRIEHAQVVDPDDVHLFGDYSVVPSVQATHATSDMKWAEDRLGPVRIQGAYAYKSLMNQNGWIANGTDFPIEGISPLLTFYAATARKDLKGFPEGGFQMKNGLTREEVLRSITIWAAKADFMETYKGSLEPGKDADFVVLDRDIMQIPILIIPSVQVEQTYIKGERVK